MVRAQEVAEVESAQEQMGSRFVIQLHECSFSVLETRRTKAVLGLILVQSWSCCKTSIAGLVQGSGGIVY